MVAAGVRGAWRKPFPGESRPYGELITHQRVTSLRQPGLVPPSTGIRLAGMLLAITLASCGGSTATPTPSDSPSAVHDRTLTVDGRDRTYRVFAPPSLGSSQTAPLVIALHGLTQDGEAIETWTRFDDEAKASRFIVAYPYGIGNSWNAGGCCGDASAKGVDDVVFISRLLDRLTVDYPIDRTRVFIAGLSNGAMMAYRLACQLSDRIAAAASVAGALVFDDCRPARPVSILEMHGTDDSVVPYAGDSAFPSTTSTIQRWVTLDDCGGNPTQSVVGITKTSTWIGCRGGTVVRFDTVVGGPHTWFGRVDPNTLPGEPNATKVIWDFFQNLAPRA
jgi:polyhydroxybutyrate depolymerase